MSIARAFTKRSKRPSDPPEPLPGRAISMRKPGQGIDRNLISSPVQLISTTNMLSYNAPDLPNPTLRHASTSSTSSVTSKKSADDSDVTMSSPDLTDASSVESSSPTSPKLNHLSSYFASAAAAAPPATSTPPPGPRPNRSASTTSLNAKAASNDASPAVPQRALSHSKQAHEQVARQRSMSGGRSSGNLTPRSSKEFRASREQRASTDVFRAVNDDPNHPFGKELEQLKEVVEEFGGVIAEAEMNEDIIFMRDHGLSKFSVSDYLFEIQPLFGRAFVDNPAPRLTAVSQDSYGWI